MPDDNSFGPDPVPSLSALGPTVQPEAYGVAPQTGLSMPTYDLANSVGDEAVDHGIERGQQFRLQAAGPPISKIEMNIDDDGNKTYKIHANEHAVDWMQNMVDIGQKAIAARDEQIKAIQAKKAMLESNPILSQVGRLASFAAGQYFAPGSRGAALVRGAGLFGGETFGKTPEDLGEKISELETEKFGIATAEERTAIQQQHETNEEELNWFNRQQAANRVIELQKDRVEKRYMGAITAGKMTPELFARAHEEMMHAGANKTDADSWQAAMEAQNKAAAEDQGYKFEKWTDGKGVDWRITYDRNGKEVKRDKIGQGQKTQAIIDKEQQDQYIETISDALAANKLIGFREMGGMGSGPLRFAVIARTLKKNPAWDSASLDAALKTYQNYMVQGDNPRQPANQLQSIGTALEHGEDIRQAILNAPATDLQILNKTWREIQDKYTGSATYQALQTPIQAYQKEAERFLLGGYALQEEDRKTAKSIIDGTMPLDRMEAAVRSMDKVMADKANELAQGWRRNMHTELPDSIWTPEAKRAAANVKVNLPGALPEQEKQGPQTQPPFRPDWRGKPNFRYRSVVDNKEYVTDANGKPII